MHRPSTPPPKRSQFAQAWRSFSRDLRQEWKNLLASVRTVEFWIVFTLLAVGLLVLVMGLVIGSGFDSESVRHIVKGLRCMPSPSNLQVAMILIGGLIYVFAFVFSLGEYLWWKANVKRYERPGGRRSRSPAILVFAALGIGLAGCAVIAWNCL